MTIEQFKKHLPELNRRIEEATYGYGCLDFHIRGDGLVFVHSSDSFSEQMKPVFKQWLVDIGIPLEDCQGEVFDDEWIIHWSCVIWNVWSEKGYAVQEEWILHNQSVA